MATTPDPFLASGISLGIPNTDATMSEQVDNVLFLDSEGNLRFKDAWIVQQTDIDGNAIESVSLQDLWTRINGVYVKDGKLYFKDGTVTRAYSLHELVSAYVDTKNRLTNGGIYWIGRTAITNAECENVMINIDGDPALAINADGSRVYEKVDSTYPENAIGTKVFSIDKYISDSTFTGGTYKTDTDGNLRWHDVPNLQLLVPPLDENKVVMLSAKATVRLIEAENPVLLRLYDETTAEVLDQIAVMNKVNEPVEQQPSLQYYGVLSTYQSTLEQLACDCPTTQQKENSEEEPPHTIKVQFYVDDHLTADVFDKVCSVTPETAIISGCVDGTISGGFTTILEDSTLPKYNSKERRIFGIPNKISTEPMTNSNINCVIFDTTPKDIVGRKTGQVSFANQDLIKVSFSKAFSSTDYSISLSCNKNINVFWSNKKTTGFTIQAEKKFTGSVDWIATKTIFEGEA
jgi:hypothetical protein